MSKTKDLVHFHFQFGSYCIESGVIARNLALWCRGSSLGPATPPLHDTVPSEKQFGSRQSRKRKLCNTSIFFSPIMFACLMLHHRAQLGVYRGRHKEPHKCLFKAFCGSSRVVKPPRVGDFVIILSTLHFYYFHIFHFTIKERTRKELKFWC